MRFCQAEKTGVVEKTSRDIITTCGPIRFNAEGSPVLCSLPCVPKFNTSLACFRNQITRQVLQDINRRCRALVSLPPGALIQLAEATESLLIRRLIELEVLGLSINSLTAALRNVRFEVIAVDSAVIQVTGELVITVVYTGVDSLSHTQEVTVAFSEQITVPGDFPANVIVNGTLTLDNISYIENIDPSLLVIESITVVAQLTAFVRILVPSDLG